MGKLRERLTAFSERERGGGGERERERERDVICWLLNVFATR